MFSCIYYVWILYVRKYKCMREGIYVCNIIHICMCVDVDLYLTLFVYIPMIIFIWIFLYISINLPILLLIVIYTYFTPTHLHSFPTQRTLPTQRKRPGRESAREQRASEIFCRASIINLMI